MINLENIDQKQARFLKRAADTDRLAHAYLFVSEDEQRGLNTAYWLACYLNCEGKNKPDGKCSNCRRIIAGDHPDVMLVRPEIKHSLSIDQVRPLKEELAKNPVESGFRFFFIEYAEKLTLAAANGLLNLLEEPVAPVVTILITQNQDKILPTIRSRAQLIVMHEDNLTQKEQRLLASGLTREEIAEIGDSSKLDQKIKYFFQNMLQQNDLAFIDAHELSALKSIAQQKYIFIRLKELATSYLSKQPQAAAAMLQSLIMTDKMKIANVSFKNRLDYLVLAEEKAGK